MNEIEDSLGGSGFANANDGLEARIFRVMAVSVVVAATATALLAPWRVATGLLLGGALSLLNYRWLRTSIAALIERERPGKAVTANGVALHSQVLCHCGAGHSGLQAQRCFAARDYHWLVQFCRRFICGSFQAVLFHNR